MLRPVGEVVRGARTSRNPLGHPTVDQVTHSAKPWGKGCGHDRIERLKDSLKVAALVRVRPRRFHLGVKTLRAVVHL